MILTNNLETLGILFSKTDYILSNRVIFPVNYVIGLNLTCLQSTLLPINLANIECIRHTDYYTYKFWFKDKTNIENIYLEVNDNMVMDKYNTVTFPFKNIDGLYIGCMTVYSDFMNWLKTTSFSDTLNQDCLIINPSYCRLDTNITDYRLKYESTVLDTICVKSPLQLLCTEETKTSEQPDYIPDTFIKWQLVLDETTNIPKTQYVKELTVRVKDAYKKVDGVVVPVEYKLTGENLLFIMDKGSNTSNLNTFVFDGRTLYLTDELKQEESYD